MLILYFIIFLIIFVYYYFTRNFNYWKSRNVPGPKPVPLFGNIKAYVLREKNMGLVFKKMYDDFSNEKVVGIYRMTTPCLLLRDLEVIKHVMIKDFDNFVDRGISFSKNGLGKNLFHADDETWRILRHRFNPIFTPAKLKNMVYLLVEQADKVLNYIEDICRTQSEQNMPLIMQRYTMGTIAACAFGIDLENFQKEQMDTIEKIHKLIFTVNYAGELDMMYPGILTKLNSSLFPKEVTSFFQNLVKKVIIDRKNAPVGRNDFMDIILQMRQQREIVETRSNKNITLNINDDIIAAQAFVFYAAGYETSATTTAYMLYELAKHPEIQNKLIEEVDDLLEKCTGKLTYDDLKQCTYLDMVLKETLRFYAIVDPLLRRASADYNIPGTTVKIKKGQTVIISATGIHHDPKHYPDPEIFDPERFSPEAERKRHSCAYLPFGEGLRNCIGMRFAKVQILVYMVKFLSRFRVELSKDTKPIIFNPKSFIMAPQGGLFLNIVPRKN